MSGRSCGVLTRPLSFQDDDLARTCEESARLEAAYKHYFDLVLVNRNAEVTFRR